MREIPLLMNGPMVRAVLAGNKTQTRRIAKHVVSVHAYTGEPLAGLDSAGPRVPCPYGQVGDSLWVRETWQYADWTEEGDPYVGYAADGKRILIQDYPEAWAKRLEEVWCELSDPKNYDIDNRAADRRWRPNIHMPRWACRILLEVTGVRVERLQDGEGEAAWESRYLAEGIHKIDHGRGDHYFSALRSEPHPKNWADPFDAWRELWSSIGGDWEANPWVWVIEFKRAK